MSNCCSSPDGNNAHPNKIRCPADGNECMEVSVRTIIHHLKTPWSWTPFAAHYFFCDSPGCDVVYFGDDHSVIRKSQLRTAVGVKEPSASSLLCYCFGVTRANFEDDPAVRDFVIRQTSTGACSCETSNPSGRCCLKDFPKPQKPDDNFD